MVTDKNAPFLTPDIFYELAARVTEVKDNSSEDSARICSCDIDDH